VTFERIAIGCLAFAAAAGTALAPGAAPTAATTAAAVGTATPSPATASATPSAATAGGTGPNQLTCSAHILNVALADPGPAEQRMWGELCYRGRREPDSVQLLVHGATYTHAYWDFGYGNGYYSYVDAATAAGYATFDVDRVGAGRSSHPVSSDVTLEAEAVALHDAVTALRTGAVDGHAFRHVMWVGHSYGAYIGWVEISRYHDIDAAIFTSGLHAFDPALPGQFASDFYPAVDDPLFADTGLDPGYLTSKPGTRESLFYYPRTADPKVVALDEATKGTITAIELSESASDLDASLGVTVPVLLVDGEYDDFFCLNVTAYTCADPASVLAFESRYYPAGARLDLVIIPGTGHDLALSTTAPLTDAVMLHWARRTVQP
jgi:pimeloyl-ACP methyl ester carboxylesterase